MLPIYVRRYLHLNLRANVYVIVSSSYALNASSREVCRPLSFVGRLHRYSHAHPADLIHLPEREGYKYPKLPDVVHKVSAAYLP